jgi:UDP-glucose 4-epimerase
MRNRVLIFGNDWATKDGTPTRDFVHVVDLADALTQIIDQSRGTRKSDNKFGTSTGSTVLEVVKTAEVFLKKSISYQFETEELGTVSH